MLGKGKKPAAPKAISARTEVKAEEFKSPSPPPSTKQQQDIVKPVPILVPTSAHSSSSSTSMRSSKTLSQDQLLEGKEDETDGSESEVEGLEDAAETRVTQRLLPAEVKADEGVPAAEPRIDIPLRLRELTTAISQNTLETLDLSPISRSLDAQTAHLGKRYNKVFHGQAISTLEVLENNCVLTCDGKTICVWDAITGKPIFSFPEVGPQQYSYSSCSIQKDLLQDRIFVCFTNGDYTQYAVIILNKAGDLVKKIDLVPLQHYQYKFLYDSLQRGQGGLFFAIKFTSERLETKIKQCCVHCFDKDGNCISKFEPPLPIGYTYGNFSELHYNDNFFITCVCFSNPDAKKSVIYEIHFFNKQTKQWSKVITGKPGHTIRAQPYTDRVWINNYCIDEKQAVCESQLLDIEGRVICRLPIDITKFQMSPTIMSDPSISIQLLQQYFVVSVNVHEKDNCKIQRCSEIWVVNRESGKVFTYPIGTAIMKLGNEKFLLRLPQSKELSILDSSFNKVSTFSVPVLEANTSIQRCEVLEGGNLFLELNTNTSLIYDPSYSQQRQISTRTLQWLRSDGACLNTITWDSSKEQWFVVFDKSLLPGVSMLASKHVGDSGNCKYKLTMFGYNGELIGENDFSTFTSTPGNTYLTILHKNDRFAAIQFYFYHNYDGNYFYGCAILDVQKNLRFIVPLNVSYKSIQWLPLSPNFVAVQTTTDFILLSAANAEELLRTQIKCSGSTKAVIHKDNLLIPVDNIIRIFNTRNFQQIGVIAGHPTSIQKFVCYENYIVTTASDGTKIWSLEDFSCKKYFRLIGGNNYLEISPQGVLFVVTAGNQLTIDHTLTTPTVRAENLLPLWNALAGSTKVQECNLNGISLVRLGFANFLQMLRQNKSIKRLLLQNTDLSDAEIPELVNALRANITLTEIVLHGTKITWQGIQKLYDELKGRIPSLLIQHEYAKNLFAIDAVKEQLAIQKSQFESVIQQLRTEIDQLRVFKSNNPHLWEDIIAGRDMARVSQLIASNVDPRGISFITVAEEKELQQHIDALRTRGAIFTVPQLVSDTDAALTGLVQAPANTDYLSRLREGIMQLLNLWRQGRLLNQAATQMMNRAALNKLEPILATPNVSAEVPRGVKQAFIQKIQGLRAEKHQAWLRNILPPTQLQTLDDLVARRFWEKLKTDPAAENSSYPQIQLNIKTCFITRLQQGTLPPAFIEQATEALISEMIELHKQGQLAQALGTALAGRAEKLKDPTEPSGPTSELYLRRAANQLLQSWLTHQLDAEEQNVGEALIGFIGSAIEPKRSLEQDKWPRDARDLIENDALRLLIKQLKGNQLSATLTFDLNNQILQLLQGQKGMREDEIAEALQRLLLSWQRQELSPEDSAFIYQKTTESWQGRLAKLNKAIDPLAELRATQAVAQQAQASTTTLPSPQLGSLATSSSSTSSMFPPNSLFGRPTTRISTSSSSMPSTLLESPPTSVLSSSLSASSGL